MTIRSRDRKNAQRLYWKRMQHGEPAWDKRNHDPKPQRSIEQLRASRQRYEMLQALDGGHHDVP